MKKFLSKACIAIFCITCLGLAFGALWFTADFSRNQTADNPLSWTDVEEDMEYRLLAGYVSVRKEYGSKYERIYEIEADSAMYRARYSVQGTMYLMFAWKYQNHAMITNG